ncbi:nucleotide-binding domain-containing protein [Mycena galericulata]|nr:nucleotide-binding domain-containing protein [Mycena galericulata]
MGSLLSRARLIYQTLKSISDSFSALSERISRDPGLPVPNPSRSYWCVPPSSLDSLSSSTDKKLPEHADVVIIGSGIAGTAVARTLLDSYHANSQNKTPLCVVMLDARDVCSGATGRNGGHVSPNTYQDYAQLARTYGASAAREIMRFRLAHLPALLVVAKEEDLLRDSQARTVEQFDVFLQDAAFRRAQDALKVYTDALPERREKHRIQDDKLFLQDLQLSKYAIGCISQAGGALHPYRLVTGILSRLVSAYPRFQLYTHTPCTGISSPSGPDAPYYVVSTPRGTLTAAHVVHTTNAWTAHLLPGMRRIIVPVRAHMTAQRPGRTLRGSIAGISESETGWAGTRAFVFHPGSSPVAFDYLTQQPVPVSTAPSEGDIDEGGKNVYPAPAGEFMFGGGAMLGGRGEAAAMDNIGVADDSECDFEVTAYLGGALERYFARGWGEEASGDDAACVDAVADATADAGWGKGRMKAAWSGILGISADGQPWVGRVPRAISQRAEPAPPPADAPTSMSTDSVTRMARPGEWIAAGFTGEGMTHAWLSGVALARMILGDATSVPGAKTAASEPTLGLPPPFVITEKRWRAADIEAFLGDIGDA